MQKNFVVICQARTGSTMLMTALQNHPDICAHGEVLNNRTDDNLEFIGVDYKNPGQMIDIMREELANSPSEYLQKFVFRNGKHKVVGFKFKYEELSNNIYSEARNFIQRRKDIYIIQLKRKNLWQRYISEYVALNLTKQFNSQEQTINIPEQTISIEPRFIEEAFVKSEKWNNQFKFMFRMHPFLEVVYEDILNSPEENFDSITKFLSIPKVKFEPRTKKIETNKNILSQISNIQEIVEYFEETKYKGLF